ncbi:MAG: aminotransferase class I/II-fold pyridoxal phosphate-dependent enzyme, partial [Myxococcales bacterium]|nr:aminotransferase class I/II-fold pyridoxal phosphate-dependent enzyme [Myxococcales bacterium]
MTKRQLQTRLDNMLKDLQASDLLRTQRIGRWASPVEVDIDGKRVLSFASNDYLGLRHDARVLQALVDSTDGAAGSGASRLVTGSHAEHASLESVLADWMATPAARLFNSGYHANSGLFAAVTRPGDVIFSDSLNHASIIDGIR